MCMYMAKVEGIDCPNLYDVTELPKIIESGKLLEAQRVYWDENTGRLKTYRKNNDTEE